eukprot:TRINITY_DN13748_c0_g4_i1.p2 TRINITY_DN13748_c0_g4~~TRINITY_DN13748_c0_g4_i1.p2  ORF type:complete len:169 (+),score=27.52 TRINITY_DN13748_c0_g4_i1:764-1270(+)
MLCWIATWAYSLLRDGFGFPLHSKQLTWRASDWGGGYDLRSHAKEDKNESVQGGLTWTTGQMMYEVNYYPWRISHDETISKKQHKLLPHSGPPPTPSPTNSSMLAEALWETPQSQSQPQSPVEMATFVAPYLFCFLLGLTPWLCSQVGKRSGASVAVAPEVEGAYRAL